MMLERWAATHRRKAGGRTPRAVAPAAARTLCFVLLCFVLLPPSASAAAPWKPPAWKAAAWKAESWKALPGWAGETRLDRYGDPLPRGAVARIGTTRFVGWGPFAYAPGGEVYCCGTGDQAAVCDAATGRVLLPLEGHAGDVRCIAYAPRGDLLATVDGQGTLRIWNAGGGGLLRQVRFVHGTAAAAFSPDGERIAAGGNHGLCVWKVSDGQVLAELKSSYYTVCGVAFLADGKTLALGEATRPLWLWDGVPTPADAPGGIPGASTRGRLPTRFADSYRESRLAVAPDGSTAALGRSNEGWIEIWNLAQRRRAMRFFAHEKDVRLTAFSADGRLLATADQAGEVRIWKTSAGQRLRTLPSCGGLRQLAFSPDGKTLTGSSARCGDRLRMWDVGSGKLRRLVDAPDGDVLGLAFAENSSTALWTASTGDPFVRCWDPRRGVCIRAVPLDSPRVARSSASPAGPASPSGVPASKPARRTSTAAPVRPSAASVRLAVASDGRTAAVSRRDGVRLIDLVGGAAPRRLAGPELPVDGLEFSRDGRMAAVRRRGGDLQVWDVRKGMLRARFPSDGRAGPPRFDGGVAGLSWDGETIVHTLFGSNLRCCDVASGAAFRIDPERKSLDCLAVSPDGESIAAADESNGIRFWNLRTGDFLFRIEREVDARGLRSLQFSPDGRTLAATSYDSMLQPTAAVQLYEVAAARRFSRLDGGTGGVGAIAFSPDGRSLAAGGFHGAALIWALDGRAGLAAAPFGPDDLPALWESLRRRELDDVDALLWQAAAFPQAVPFLRARLTPPPPSPRARTLAAELDDDRFVVREQAEAELAELGGAARSALRNLLEGPAPLEARFRAERLRRRDQDPRTPENLRAARAVAILERSADPDARRFLQELASGDSDAVLAREAKRALVRREAASAQR